MHVYIHQGYKFVDTTPSIRTKSEIYRQLGYLPQFNANNRKQLPSHHCLTKISPLLLSASIPCFNKTLFPFSLPTPWNPYGLIQTKLGTYSNAQMIIKHSGNVSSFSR
jgi:hypothetical protein